MVHRKDKSMGPIKYFKSRAVIWGIVGIVHNSRTRSVTRCLTTSSWTSGRNSWAPMMHRNRNTLVRRGPRAMKVGFRGPRNHYTSISQWGSWPRSGLLSSSQRHLTVCLHKVDWIRFHTVTLTRIKASCSRSQCNRICFHLVELEKVDNKPVYNKIESNNMVVICVQTAK